jgi:hypothetical protein
MLVAMLTTPAVSGVLADARALDLNGRLQRARL